MNEEITSRERLIDALYKVAGWAGVDITELIEDGYLEEGDLG